MRSIHGSSALGTSICLLMIFVNVSAMLWQNGGVFEIIGKVPFGNAADYNEF